MLQFYMLNIDKEQYLIDKFDSIHIGDDAAVVNGNIYSADAFFEDVHFRREWMSLTQIARKSLLVNFSDAIAMNAKPKYALITLSIPKDISMSDIDELTSSFAFTAQEFDCEIIGGDTVGGDKLNISVTVISQSNSVLYRKGLKCGDLLAYTGVLGNSKKDLDRLFLGKFIDQGGRFLEPVLRGDFISKSREFLSSGMDISDGLFCDTNKLMDINKLGFDLIKNINDETGLSGEEYEMLIGIKPECKDSIVSLAHSMSLDITIFATVCDNSYRFPCKGHHF